MEDESLHAEAVLLFRTEANMAEFLPDDLVQRILSTGQYPPGTTLHVFGKYGPKDRGLGLKPPCQDICQSMKVALNIQ